MRRDRAEERAKELQKTAAAGETFVAAHLGRNRWVVRKGIERDGVFSSEVVER